MVFRRVVVLTGIVATRLLSDFHDAVSTSTTMAAEIADLELHARK